VNALRARLQALFGGFGRWYAGHSVRDQRIIMGVLVFAGICLIYLFGWVPLRDYRQRVAEEIADGQDQLARASRSLGAADSLRAERESLRKRLVQARTRLLPGRGGTLGAAALQERANSIASEKGITVQSTQVMKEEAVDPYRKVAVRLTLSGELKPFAELVSGLEYGQQLAIPFVEINRRGAAPGAKGPRTLSATLEVTGFVLGEQAKAEEGAPAEAEGPQPNAEEANGSKPGAAPGSIVAPTGALTATTVAGAPATVAGAPTTTLPGGTTLPTVPGAITSTTAAGAVTTTSAAGGVTTTAAVPTTTTPGAHPTTTLSPTAAPSTNPRPARVPGRH
jgi:Tfp pilus assembly protein PilO